MFGTTALTPAKPQPALNEGQRAAAEGFFQFLFEEGKELIISGPGGVGKTFLMGHLIDVIMPRYFEMCKLMGIEPLYDMVEMCATTNKAAEALSLATGRPTSTIHSLLRLKVVEDYETGEQKISRTRDWIPHARKIIFIDECSMIDTALWEEIRASTVGCKIVYVGDHCQLAPVKELLSPIYNQGLPFYELTEPMRNNGQPALMAVCQQLRHTVETGEFKPIQIVPGVIDWLNDDQMQTMLAQLVTDPHHQGRILAYTNQRVIEFNDFIRDMRQLPGEWTVGEELINNSAIQFSRRMLSVEEQVTVLNQKGSTQMVPIEQGVEFEVRLTDLATKLGEVFRDVPLPVDREHFSNLLKYYAREAKGKRKPWSLYFNLKNKYPDLRPRDAATTHKAQGSTHDFVFIDVGNISTCNFPNQVARLLYVAFSRPRTRIFLFGDLAAKYGGLIH
jgi:hypothetical protein